MNRREAAVFTAYTGITFGSFGALHRYAEEALRRPIWTHEFADKALWTELKDAAKEEFLDICGSVNELPEEEWETTPAEYTDESYARGVESMISRLPEDKPVHFIQGASDVDR